MPKSTPPNPAGDLNKRLRDLVMLSKKQGFLTADDLQKAFPDSNREESATAHAFFENLEVEIRKSAGE